MAASTAAPNVPLDPPGPYPGKTPRALVVVFWCSVTGLLGGGLGCHTDSTAPTTGATLHNASTAYWALQLNQHAINMATVAPYNTVQLIVTPSNIAGVPLTGIGQPAFHVGDSTVTVDATGRVTAHFATQGQPTQVIATLTADGYTLSDTAFIQVTDTVPQQPLTVFSIQPALGDSAKRAVDANGGGFSWPVTAATPVGVVCNASQCPLLVSLVSSNPKVATFSLYGGFGFVSPKDTGRVVLSATMLYYGVPKRDTLVFSMGYPIQAFHAINPNDPYFGLAGLQGSRLLPRQMIVGQGAVVTFANFSQQPAGVTFDDSAQVESSCAEGGLFGEVCPATGRGNIPAFQFDGANIGSGLRARHFPEPGTYVYHTSLAPADTFAVVVRAEH